MSTKIPEKRRGNADANVHVDYPKESVFAFVVSAF